MNLVVVICHPDEPPHLEEIGRFEIPDGMTGMLACQAPNGMPSLAMMPVNEMRPKLEQMSDYLVALACGRTYMRYQKLENLEKLNIKNQEQKELTLAMFIRHFETVMDMVAREAVEQGLMDKQTVNTLCELGFEFAHDRCCDDPVCKAQMHKLFHKTNKLS